jgi:hypothetical protein
MLRLTTETGQSVHGADGTHLGHLADVSVRLGPAHPPVVRLAVRLHRHGATQSRRELHLLDWSGVVTFEHTRVQLRTSGPLDGVAAGPGRPLPLADDELLLRRDVLDTQIVDVSGQRVERVGDVLLVRTTAGLEAAAVDVGFGAVVRRLGLDRLAQRLPEQAIDWSDLHLTSARGHDVQLAVPASALHRLDRVGLADLLARLPTEDAADVAAAVDPALAGAALASSHPEVGARVALALEDTEAGPVLAAVPGEQGRHLRLLRRDRAVRRRFERHRSWRRFLPTTRSGPTP